MKEESTRQHLLNTLRGKSCMKQDVHAKTMAAFTDLKEVLNDIAEDFSSEITCNDQRIEIAFKSQGHYEAELKFAGDVLLFHMHTNVFDFDKSHPVWKTSYAKDVEFATFCGMINIYNFLADSLKYNRVNDAGYLVARIFINKDGHFFVEGKKQLGFLYNDFLNSVITKEALRKIVESAMMFSLDFDLLTPPYDVVREITVNEIDMLTSEMRIKTAKRMGFRSEVDENAKHD